MPDQNKIRTVHYYHCTADSSNEERTVFEPTGTFVQFRSSRTGYQEHAHLLSSEPKFHVKAGLSKSPGHVSFDIEDGGDDASSKELTKMEQMRSLVIVCYRQYILRDDEWKNDQCTMVWGRIAGCQLQQNSSSLYLEIHVLRNLTEIPSGGGHTGGTDDYSIDCMTGDKGEPDIGPRTPKIIAPPNPAAEGNNWAAFLMA